MSAIAIWVVCTAAWHFWRILMESDFGAESDQSNDDLSRMMVQACILGSTMVAVDLLVRIATRRAGWKRYGWVPAIALAGVSAYALARSLGTPIPYRFSVILAGLSLVPRDDMSEG